MILKIPRAISCLFIFCSLFNFIFLIFKLIFFSISSFNIQVVNNWVSWFNPSLGFYWLYEFETLAKIYKVCLTLLFFYYYYFKLMFFQFYYLSFILLAIKLPSFFICFLEVFFLWNFKLTWHISSLFIYLFLFTLANF